MGLCRGSCANPIIVLANYVLSSLPHDAFCIVDGQLHEVLLTSKSSREIEPDRYDPGLVQRCVLKWNSQPVDCTSYYSGPQTEWNKLLKFFAERPELQTESNFLLPVGALACMKSIQSLSQQPCIWLVADKGV